MDSISHGRLLGRLGVLLSLSVAVLHVIAVAWFLILPGSFAAMRDAGYLVAVLQGGLVFSAVMLTIIVAHRLCVGPAGRIHALHLKLTIVTVSPAIIIGIVAPAAAWCPRYNVAFTACVGALALNILVMWQVDKWLDEEGEEDEEAGAEDKGHTPAPLSA
jgi:hypothetical protein